MDISVILAYYEDGKQMVTLGKVKFTIYVLQR